VSDEVSEIVQADLAHWCVRWDLVQDGPAFSTASSVLAPVLADGRPAMLKIATVGEERVGNHVMAWWNGRSAATVLHHDGEALLLDRAVGTGSLAAMSGAGNGPDDEATRILCSVATQLHGASSGSIGRDAPAGLRTLEDWFRDLLLHTEEVTGFYARSAQVARELLADQRDEVVLHGDMHHGNVLDFGALGWRAIDPKGIVGDRAFDFANILCNPDAEVALRPGRLARQVDVIADAAGLAPERILRWAVAWCGLSATWMEQDNQQPGHTLVVGLAAEHLSRTLDA
jgi:streptomycin 6-kinase